MPTCLACSFREPILEPEGTVDHGFCLSERSSLDGTRSRGFVNDQSPSCSQFVSVEGITRRFGRVIARLLTPPPMRPGTRAKRLIEFAGGPREGRVHPKEQITTCSGTGAVEAIDDASRLGLEARLRVAFQDEGYWAHVRMDFVWPFGQSAPVLAYWEETRFDRGGPIRS